MYVCDWSTLNELIIIYRLCFFKNQTKFQKQNVLALERRLELWENGNIIELLNEGESITNW